MKSVPDRALYLAVLPAYRQSCVEVLLEADPKVRLFAASAHLDSSVKTSLPSSLYTSTRIFRIGRQAFVQFGSVWLASRSRHLVVDLNPRSLTAWALLLLRRPFKDRRTVVWGHLHPRKGASSGTAGLRRRMRALADGTLLYTVTDAATAEQELPGKPVWSATNALYRSENIYAADHGGERDAAIYVGRLVASKKVELAVQAVALAREQGNRMRLVLVGDGAEAPKLRTLVGSLGLNEVVELVGWCDDLDQLREYYSRAFVALSPGYAGLGLVQAAGMGLKTLVAQDEPHSPEIELEVGGAVTWFESDNVEALARQVTLAWDERRSMPNHELARWTRENYSAEAMAAGIFAALGGSVIGLPRD